jgi:hypothetical protein
MSIRESIAEAFKDVPYPGDDQIALHECAECRQIREDFRGQTPQGLTEAVLERCFDSLPLISPAAFHYFVPAYMFHALDHPDSVVALFACLSLGQSGIDGFYLERFRLFNSQQREATIAFLEFFKSYERENDDPDVRERLEKQNKFDVSINLWKGLP